MGKRWNWVMAVLIVTAFVLGSTTAASAVEDKQIKELMRLIEMQQAQIDALKAKVEALSATQAEQIEKVEAPAKIPKGVARSGNDKVALKLYGQVDRAMLVADDGNNTDTYFVDNDSSSTRFGMLAHVQANDDIKIGSKFEVQFESNSSSAVNQENKHGVGPNNFTERHLDFYVESKRFGKLSLGQGDTATNGTTEVDLSGTAIIGYADPTVFAGNYLFYDNNTDMLPGTRIKDVMTNMDGMSRDDRVRYDTPKFYGFNLSGGVISGTAYDAALWYAQKFSGVKVAGAVGWANPRDLKSWDDQISGSISVLLDMGLNFTVAAGQRDYDEDGRDNANYWYGKIGYKKDFWGIGPTAFSLDYGEYKEISQNDDDAQNFGLMFVQKVNHWATEFYAGYRWHELDREGDNFDNINALMTGARLKF